MLRYTNGTPITTRRYDHLWKRIGTHLAWVATQQISTHWLRHTTLTWVERNYGYAIARAYAGHTDTPAETRAPPPPTSAPPSRKSLSHSPASPENPTHWSNSTTDPENPHMNFNQD